MRGAQLADISGITECYLRSWRAAYASDLPAGVLEAEAEKRRAFDWSRGIEADTSAVFVAAEADHVLGVIQADDLLPAPRNLPEITMLYVDPPSWGSGVASLLLRSGLEWIDQQGHREARLRVVEVHHRARRFYEREGWVVDLRLPPARNDFFSLIYYCKMLGG